MTLNLYKFVSGTVLSSANLNGNFSTLAVNVSLNAINISSTQSNLANYLQKVNNLSDINNASTALANLGGQASLGYTPLRPSNNLSDVSNASTALANLGGISTASQVPYSVNSGAVSSGYASFITSLSNSSVKIAATATNIVLTHANSATETISADYTITGMSSNGTYNIVKEYGSNPSASINTITEAFVAPSSPSSGDYWLNIGIKPYQPYKYNGSAWVSTQFVRLGEVTISGGVMGTPISYAFNGYYYKDNISTPSNGTNTAILHNIGTTYNAKLMLKNITTELGYGVGEMVDTTLYDANASNTLPLSKTNRNSLNICSGSMGFYLMNKSTFHSSSITIANWNVVIEVRRAF